MPNFDLVAQPNGLTAWSGLANNVDIDQSVLMEIKKRVLVGAENSLVSHLDRAA
jgi:hypothetical protein